MLMETPQDSLTELIFSSLFPKFCVVLCEQNCYVLGNLIYPGKCMYLTKFQQQGYSAYVYRWLELQN